MFYDPRTEPHGLKRNPWLALVSPRPIGWISTISSEGKVNLAPFSCFNAISSTPPFVMFSSVGAKDTLHNIQQTGEFVVNIVTWDLREEMNVTSAPVAHGVDEFQLAGLEKSPCKNVKPPRVTQSPASIECILNRTIPLEPRSGLPCDTIMIIGEVVGINIDEAILSEGLIDIKKLRPISRLGYMNYAVIDEVFEMHRPRVE